MIELEDLAPFATIPERKAKAMIQDAVAMAYTLAPCLPTMGNDVPEYKAARAVIRGAILRWNEAGSGAAVQLGAGQFQQTIDTRQIRRGMFWPSEIADLQRLCKQRTGRAFTIDTTPCHEEKQHPFEGVWVNGPSEDW